jgi:hypothetical protein
MSFQDHFSGHAALYGAFRPGYPAALFDYLASVVPDRELAWDAATGNGQAAIGLAPYFDQVIATDPSTKQLAEAQPHPKIRYLVLPADEAPPLPRAADLVTVAQALHWFDLETFYALVRRVACQGGLLAAWCYGRHTINARLDEVVDHLGFEIVGHFWPPERKLVDDKYETIPFPFEELDAPALEIALRWNLGQMMGYIESWSATQRYRKETGYDPLDLVRSDLESAWGDPDKPRLVTWPIYLRVGKVD